jgi:hypothetical protein
MRRRELDEAYELYLEWYKKFNKKFSSQVLASFNDDYSPCKDYDLYLQLTKQIHPRHPIFTMGTPIQTSKGSVITPDLKTPYIFNVIDPDELTESLQETFYEWYPTQTQLDN